MRRALVIALFALLAGTGSAATVSSSASISLSVPNNGQNLAGTVPVDVGASGNVIRVEFYLDNALKFTDSSAPYEWQWNTTTTTDGSHIVRAEAVYKTRRAKAQLAVTVKNTVAADTTPPVISKTPAGDQTVTAADSSGAVVAWTTSATDPDDQAGPVTCSPASGTKFAVGTTAVSCSSTDTHSNTGTLGFNVIVQPPSSGGTYYGTDPSGACTSRLGCSSIFPRSASFCASTIIRNSWEPRPENATANNTVGDGIYTWGPSGGTDTYWQAWHDRVALVQGQFTGTTTEHFSWAACRWGIDEDLIRAVAVQESHWSNSDKGDVCSPDVTDEGSFGLTQIKNKTCSGALDQGGYPDTIQSTALNVDFYAAKIRTCYDGDFYDGGSWLYKGQTVAQIAAANGWDYVLWGCVGYWFSGSWYDSGAQSYIASVKSHLANRDWLKY